MENNSNQVDHQMSYTNGRLAFFAGVLDRLHIPETIGRAVTSDNGRPPDIPYDVLTKLFLINIADQHTPLYRLREFYQQKDLKGLTGMVIDSEKLYDSRFGNYLEPVL